jgi:hypothetical protein
MIKTKRTLSVKQKSALAKGRAKLAAKKKPAVKKLDELTKEINVIRKKGRKVAKTANVKKFYFSGMDDFKPLLLNSEGTMTKRKSSAKKKPATRRKARRYGTEILLGTKKRTRRKTARRYSGFGKSDLLKPLINSGVAVAGGIAGSFVVNKLPIGNAKIKAALPLVIGKNPMIQAVGTGMMVVGGLALVRQFVPTIPLLAGEDEVSLIDTSIDPTLLGAPVDLMGTEINLSADDEEYISALDI